jgi:hypothetical protein
LAEDRKSARGKSPVTWHPLFPAMLAVWFGALFGLGVLAVRTGLLEAAVRSVGIDGLIPAAAPPLGATARILLALAFAVTGGAIGGVIGVLMARARPDKIARRAEAATAKEAARDIRAAERAVADQAEAPVAEAGETLGFIDISQLNLDDELRIEPEPEIEAAPEMEILAAETPETAAELKPARAFERPLDPVSFPLPESFPVPGGAAAARLTAASLDSLSHLELIERLALSLQKRREEAAAQPNETAETPDTITTAAAITAPAKPTPSYYPPVSESAAERGYASLLGLSRPAVQAEDEDGPAIARFPDSFPPAGAARQTPEATERALRDALATLQRMSGAA